MKGYKYRLIRHKYLNVDKMTYVSLLREDGAVEATFLLRGKHPPERAVEIIVRELGLRADQIIIDKEVVRR